MTTQRCEKGHWLAPTLRCVLSYAHAGPCMYDIESVLAACQPATSTACVHPLSRRKEIAGDGFNLAGWCCDCGAIDSGGGWVTPADRGKK